MILERLELIREGFDQDGWIVPLWTAGLISLSTLILAVRRFAPNRRLPGALLFWTWMAFVVSTSGILLTIHPFYAAVAVVGLLIVARALWAAVHGHDAF